MRLLRNHVLCTAPAGAVVVRAARGHTQRSWLDVQCVHFTECVECSHLQRMRRRPSVEVPKMWPSQRSQLGQMHWLPCRECPWRWRRRRWFAGCAAAATSVTPSATTCPDGGADCPLLRVHPRESALRYDMRGVWLAPRRQLSHMHAQVLARCHRVRGMRHAARCSRRAYAHGAAAAPAAA